MKKNTPLFTILSMLALTLFSKALGMLRQMAVAAVFAASTEGIAFSAASRLPLTLFDMLFSAAILGAFLPIYKGHLLRDEARAKAFSSAFFTFTGLMTGGFAILGVLLARPLLSLTAPNLDGETLTLAVTLLRIQFPAVLFAGLTYTLIGVMQSHEKFLLPAAISAFSNLTMLLYLAFTPKIGDLRAAVIGLAIANLISWAVQFFTLMLPLLRRGHMPHLTSKLKDPDLLLAEKRSLPVMLGAWLIPVISLTAGAFSSYIEMEGFPEGAAIVVWENAFSVFTIAGGLVTYGICNYLFPKLSARFAMGDEAGFSASVRMGLSLIFMITLPLTIFVMLLSPEIVRLLFLRGSFTEALANACTRSLMFLAPALPAYGLVEFLTRTAYSRGKVYLPLISALCGSFTGFGSALIFTLSGHLSASAVSASAVLGLVTAAILLLVFTHSLWHSASPCFMRTPFCFLLPIALSGVVMRICTHFLRKNMEKFGTFGNFVTIVLVFLSGVVVYLIWIFLYRKLTHNRSQ